MSSLNYTKFPIVGTKESDEFVKNLEHKYKIIDECNQSSFKDNKICMYYFLTNSTNIVYQQNQSNCSYDSGRSIGIKTPF